MKDASWDSREFRKSITEHVERFLRWYVPRNLPDSHTKSACGELIRNLEDRIGKMLSAWDIVEFTVRCSTWDELSPALVLVEVDIDHRVTVSAAQVKGFIIVCSKDCTDMRRKRNEKKVRVEEKSA